MFILGISFRWIFNQNSLIQDIFWFQSFSYPKLLQTLKVPLTPFPFECKKSKFVKPSSTTIADIVVANWRHHRKVCTPFNNWLRCESSFFVSLYTHTHTYIIRKLENRELWGRHTCTCIWWGESIFESFCANANILESMHSEKLLRWVHTREHTEHKKKVACFENEYKEEEQEKCISGILSLHESMRTNGTP